MKGSTYLHYIVLLYTDLYMCSLVLILWLCLCRNNTKEAKLKLADSFLNLGEVGMETGNWLSMDSKSLYSLCELLVFRKHQPFNCSLEMYVCVCVCV